MKRSISLYSSFMLLFFLAIACDEVFEKDISASEVALTAPQDEVLLEGPQVAFFWNRLDGADSYTIEIRDAIENVPIVDSTLTETAASFELAPGSYSWRVKAQNFGYETDFSFPRNFTIDSPQVDVSNLEIALINPEDATFFKQESIQLHWEAVTLVDTYALTLQRIQANGNMVTVLNEEGISTNSYTLESDLLGQEGVYSWSIVGKNASSQTLPATRTFSVDTTSPSNVILIDPVDEVTATSGDTLLFSWLVGQDMGEVQTAVTTILEVSNSATFDSLLLAVEVDALSYSYEIPLTADLWWRVRSVDAVGNQAESPEIRKIIVE